MTGLLLVYAERGPDVPVSDAEFNDWYDNEIAPARLAVPGFINAVRYKAIDSQTPSWLVIYDLKDSSAVNSQYYKAIAAQASDSGRDMMTHLATVDHRVYDSYSERVNAKNTPDVLPGKSIFVAEMLVQPELDEEFNRWYEEEHISELAKVPGWNRTRRYKLVSRVEIKGTDQGPTHNYLAIHELSNDTYISTPEFAAMIATPWSVKILKEVTSFKPRRFAIHKEIHIPERRE